MATQHYAPVLNFDLTATVGDGATTSGAVDLGGCTLVGVIIPTGLEGTTLAFTASDTLGGTYNTVQTNAGALSITVAASRYVALDPDLLAGVQFVKCVLSAQTGAIILTLVTRPK